MDKLVLKFFADVLYVKGVLCYEELEAINEVCTPQDLDAVFEKILRGDFNVYKRGEVFTGYAEAGASRE